MSKLGWKPGPLICIGECMVELARCSDGRFALSYGGDTFNTAVYLARSRSAISYATALGDDPYSAGIIATAKREGINTDLVRIVPGRTVGLYLVETNHAGERSFWYWRDSAPARELFDGLYDCTLAESLSEAALVYFSGITLSLYSGTGLDRFEAALQAAKAHGTHVAMDSNFRPRGWGGDKVRTQNVFRRFWGLCDIALPTLDDEKTLWGDATSEAVLGRLKAFGIAEVVIKNGADGALVASDGAPVHVACPQRVEPVDTTAAGDAFNAGYLRARINGVPGPEAALAGHRLAAVVIQHRGAIVPREATASFFAS
jgi:2-dehydro-3-deoxygluconokinase